MKFREKLKDALITRAAEGVAVLVGFLTIWIASKLAPVVLPALENNLSKSTLVFLFLATFLLNFIFLFLFWFTREKSEPKSEFKLKYGIYWDTEKNPHCPNCRVPIGGYSEYAVGSGYYCKPCNNVYPLTDASGNNINPERVISEL